MERRYPFRREFGEVVSPGHPDKLADAIADSIVGYVFRRDRTALVGVEVATSLNRVFITGRIGTTRDVLDRLDLNGIVCEVYGAAGYGDRTSGIVWSPVPSEIKVDVSGLLLDIISDGEREIRRLSDDQSITVGYAVDSPETNYIPRAQWLAWQIMDELQVAKNGRETDFGPDSKVLCEVESNDNAWKLTKLVVSMQHSNIIDWSELNCIVLEVLHSLKRRFVDSIPNFVIGIDSMDLIINGHGDFTTGGPNGDNGLSGKKLVVDAYGPMVPIGGGAFSGKDPHKVDRVGPVLAREMALRAVLDEGLSWEKVSLTWAPGSAKYITCDHSNADRPSVKKISSQLPRSIEGCCMRYFDGNDNPSLVDQSVKGWFSGKYAPPWEKSDALD